MADREGFFPFLFSTACLTAYMCVFHAGRISIDRTNAIRLQLYTKALQEYTTGSSAAGYNSAGLSPLYTDAVTGAN